MNESKVRNAPSISGHVIPLGPAHSIAVYERDGEHYVAEFRDGRGSLENAVAWFSFNARTLRCEGRDGLESTRDLDAETLHKIERLHAEDEARQEAMLAVPRRLAAALQDYVAGMVSRLRGPASSRP